MSRLHAQIQWRLGTWQIHDLGSAQGTFINGVQAVNAVVQSGDIVTFGEVAVQVEFAEQQLDIHQEIAKQVFARSTQRRKKGSLNYAESVLFQDEGFAYHPSYDGEAYIWGLLRERSKITRSDLQERCEKDQKQN